MAGALDIAAPIVAVVAAYLVYYVIGRSSLGADADWWETVRRTTLPQLNRLAARNGLGYAAYTLSWDEYVGRLEIPPERVEVLLEEAGFERMPLAAFKYDPVGRPEVGSWAYRDGHPLTAARQDHVMLFAVGDGERPMATDLYAHNEFNAFNPAFAVAHYLGVEYRPAVGIANVKRRLLEQTGWQVDDPNVEELRGQT